MNLQRRSGKRQLMNSVLGVVRKVINNRLGQLLLIVHLLVVIWLFSQKPAVSPDWISTPGVANSYSYTLIAGRVFHYHYESVFMKLVLVLDAPGLCLGFALSFLLIP